MIHDSGLLFLDHPVYKTLIRLFLNLAEVEDIWAKT